MPATMNVTVRHHAHDQCEILVSGKRVGYVCYGEQKPINWLRVKTIGFRLTEQEKIEIAREARGQMVALNEQRAEAAVELKRLQSGADAYLVAPSPPETEQE